MPSTSIVRTIVFGAVFAAATSSGLLLICQDSSPQLSPRALFYREQTSSPSRTANPAPAKVHPVTKESGTSPTTPSTSTAPSGSTADASVKGVSLVSLETSEATAASPQVSHLGLRYSLLLVDKSSGDAKAVSSTQTFDEGQCFSLEFQSNRAGYLYVFNLGSSGAWRALLPTAEMPDEANFVPAFTTTRVPSAHCFGITRPAGAERLFVVLSRNPQDVNELNRSIRNGNTGNTAEPEPSGQHEGSGGGMMTIASNLNQAVQRFASLKGRDLEIQEVGDSKNLTGPAPAVYVVHTSATPSDKVMTEIQITHR